MLTIITTGYYDWWLSLKLQLLFCDYDYDFTNMIIDYK